MAGWRTVKRTREKEIGGRDEVREGKMSQLIYLPVSMATGGLSHPLSPFSLFGSHPSPLGRSFLPNTPPVTQLGYITSVPTFFDFFISVV